MSQWLIVIILARLGGPEEVGQFALAMAIIAPVFYLFGMNMPVIVATDTERIRPLGAYLQATVLLSVLSIIASVSLGLVLGAHGSGLRVLAVLAMAKAVEALGQTMQGYFRLIGRLDVAAKSNLGRAVSGLTLFSAAYWASGALVAACVGLLVGWFLVRVLWDMPRLGWLARQDPDTTFPDEARWRPSDIAGVVREAWPLGIDAAMRSLTLSVPRFAVQTALGVAAVGVFAALSNLVLVTSLVTAAISAPMLPRLARLYAIGDAARFGRDQIRLSLFAAAVGACTVLGSWLLGEWLVAAVLGPEFVDQPLLIGLAIAIALAVVQSTVSTGLQAQRQFRSLALLTMGTLLTVALSCALLVPSMGSLGAAVSLGLGMALSILGGTVILVRNLRTVPRGA